MINKEYRESKLYPTHYTKRDGGIWLPFPASLKSISRYKLAKARVLRRLLGLSSFQYGNIKIHSLKFSSVLHYNMPRGIYLRWDIVNGWTKLRNV